MERTILIVEDNEGVAALLKELCADLDVAAVHVRGGTEAIAHISTNGLPDAVILDLVLAELDGFQVATHVRGQQNGAAVPLVVISGVYKKLPDAFEATVHPIFFPKPFDPPALRQILQERLDAADRAHGIQRGRFLRTTVSELFVRLCEQRASGLLDITMGEMRRRLWWQGGQIRFGQSNVRAETAGAMQVQKGEITTAAFDRAVAHARQAKVPLYEALVATRVLSPEKLNEALKAQTQDVAVASLDMAGGSWMLSQSDPEKMPDARRHPLSLVIEHARRVMSVEDAREALLRLGDATISRSPLLERESFVVRNGWPGETVTSLLPGTMPLVELIAKARPEDLPFLWILVTSGLAPAVRALESTPPSVRTTPPPEEIDRVADLSPAERKARQFILSERERIRNFDHYQLLGVPRDATPDVIHEAFHKSARDYHADTYSDLNLGSAQSALSELFQRLNQAHETLSDPAKRAEYDLLLARQASGLPTDVGTVLEAEEIFKRASLLLRSNAARPKVSMALELLDQAIALNDADPEFHVYRSYASFRTKTVSPASAGAAREEIGKVLEKAPNLASGYLFLGLVARDVGEDADAIRQLEKALSLDAADELAVRELRTLRTRQRKSEGSIFRRLFGK